MTKLESLVKYAQSLKERLAEKEVSKKHTHNNGKTLQEFLRRDLEKTEAKIAALRVK